MKVIKIVSASRFILFILTGFVSMSLAHVVFAQRVTNVMEVLDPNYQNSSLLYANTSPNDNPFLANEFKKANIVTVDNKTINDLEMKYDVERQVLCIDQNGTIKVLDNKRINSFTVDGSTFVKINDAYYEVLAENTVKLLKKTAKTRQNRTEANSTGYNDEAARPSRYRVNEFYYVMINDSLREIRLNKKSVLKALNDAKYEACEQRLHLRLTQLEDIKTLIKDCN